MGFQRLACTLIFLHLRLVLDLQHPEARRDAHTREDLRELRQNLHPTAQQTGPCERVSAVFCALSRACGYCAEAQEAATENCQRISCRRGAEVAPPKKNE